MARRPGRVRVGDKKAGRLLSALSGPPGVPATIAFHVLQCEPVLKLREPLLNPRPLSRCVQLGVDDDVGDAKVAERPEARLVGERGELLVELRVQRRTEAAV